MLLIHSSYVTWSPQNIAGVVHMPSEERVMISPYKASSLFVFRKCYHTTAELWRENICRGYMSGFVWSPVNTDQLNLYNECTDIIEAIALSTRGWGFGFIIRIEITEAIILRSAKHICPRRLPQKDLSPPLPGSMLWLANGRIRTQDLQ